MPFDILKSVFARKAKSAEGTPAQSASFGPRAFVAFIVEVESPRFVAPDERLSSEQASMRLRVGIPARELAKRIPVCLVPMSYLERDPTLAALGVVCAIVLAKLPVRFFIQEPERAGRLIQWLETMRHDHRVLIDFSDDLAAAAKMYSYPALAEFQRRLLGACPATASSQALQERLSADSAHRITVIEDPYESELSGVPGFRPDSVLRLVWFGVFGPPLRAFIEAQFASIARRIAHRPAEVAFLTHASQASLVAQLASALREVSAEFRVRHIDWTLSSMAQELSRADLAILPQDVTTEWGRVKSHNRLVEAIRAGRFAVVSRVPAYLELQAYAWVGDDLGLGLEWALEHPDEVRQRITAGQAYVAERFAPDRIAAKWAHVLGVSDRGSS